METSLAVPPGASTPSSICLSAAAVAAEITRWPGGTGWRRPPTDSTMCGGARIPAVGDRRICARHLYRRHQLPLSDRQVAHRGARVVAQWQDLTHFLAGQLDSGVSSEAEPMHPVAEARGTLQQADLDRADVAGLSEYLRRGERLIAMFGVVVNRPVGDLDVVGDVKARAGRDQALLQRARDRE